MYSLDANTKHVTVTSRKTVYGYEPLIESGTLSLDGYSLINLFVPCLHDGRFAQIVETTYEFDHVVGDWTLQFRCRAVNLPQFLISLQIKLLRKES
jgi:hypothetical protein